MINDSGLLFLVHPVYEHNLNSSILFQFYFVQAARKTCKFEYQ